MWKRRVGWACIIIMSIIMYIFTTGPVTLFVMIAVCVLPLLSLLALFLNNKKIQVEMSDNEVVTKGTEVFKTITFLNKGFLPIQKADIGIICENKRTGAEDEISIETGIGIKGKSERVIKLLADHCGKIVFNVSSISIYDFFGIFRKRSTEMRETHNIKDSEITVLPKRYELEVSLTSSAATMLEGDVYSKNKTGDDPGETLNIKEYVPGDPVKNMHWKLSQKMNKLLIRELGCPIVNQVIVWLDTVADDNILPEESDAIAEIFASLVDAMCLQDLTPWVGWNDEKNGVSEMRELNSEEDIKNAIVDSMSVERQLPSKRSPIRLSTDERRNNYAHVIVVGAQPEGGITDIYNGSASTFIIPEKYAGRGGVQRDGTSIVTFDSEKWDESLVNVEF